MVSGLRVSWQRVTLLAERLSERDKEIITTLARVKLLTGRQLERLCFAPYPARTRDHVRRRVLHRLVRLELVTTLERRIGGVRAGSHGLVYCLNRLGQRTADFLNGVTPDTRTRTPRTPGLAFLTHSLAVSESFVSLIEQCRITGARIRDFAAEPGCWWPDGNGGLLRPDALVIVEDDRYEAATWLEIDQGTEHIGRIRGKLAAYERFARSGAAGPDGLLPRVLFATPNAARAAAIAREIARQRLQIITCEAVQQNSLALHILQQLHP